MCVQTDAESRAEPLIIARRYTYGIAFRYPVPDPEALPPIPTAEELADWLTVLEDARAAVGKAAQDSG
jgi:hypothetical protein